MALNGITRAQHYQAHKRENFLPMSRKVAPVELESSRATKAMELFGILCPSLFVRSGSKRGGRDKLISIIAVKRLTFGATGDRQTTVQLA